jgi:hypothetical protein
MSDSDYAAFVARGRISDIEISSRSRRSSKKLRKRSRKYKYGMSDSDYAAFVARGRISDIEI